MSPLWRSKDAHEHVVFDRSLSDDPPVFSIDDDYNDEDSCFFSTGVEVDTDRPPLRPRSPLVRALVWLCGDSRTSDDVDGRQRPGAKVAVD
jgi:hypothetical protein